MVGTEDPFVVEPVVVLVAAIVSLSFGGTSVMLGPVGEEVPSPADDLLSCFEGAGTLFMWLRFWWRARYLYFMARPS